MAITVGDHVFEERTTVLREAYETVGGKETRLITITGLIRGATDRAALETALDTVIMAASSDDPVYVSLRTGRRLLARREGFSREINGARLTGQFSLTLRAEGDFEESEAVHETAWSVDAIDDTIALSNGGNVATRPVITLDALATVVAPQLSDGTRTLLYEGIVESGMTWIVDGEAAQVWLDGVDITPYTFGDFPEVAPGGGVLTYSNDAESSPLWDGEVALRDRWW